MSTRRAALESLYDDLVTEVTKQIKAGNPPAALLQVARQILVSAGITADPEHPDKPTRGLMDALAELDEEEREGLH